MFFAQSGGGYGEISYAKFALLISFLFIYMLSLSGCDFIDDLDGAEEIEDHETTIVIVDEESEDPISEAEINFPGLGMLQREVDDDGELTFEYEAEPDEDINFVVPELDDYHRKEDDFTAGSSRVEVELTPIDDIASVADRESLEEALEDEYIDIIEIEDDISLNEDIYIEREVKLRGEKGTSPVIESGDDHLIVDTYGDDRIEMSGLGVENMLIDHDGAADERPVLEIEPKDALGDDPPAVEKFTAESPVKVLGEGKIEIAYINSEDVVFENAPSALEEEEGYEATVGIHNLYFYLESATDPAVAVDDAEVTVEGDLYDETKSADDDGSVNFESLEPVSYKYNIEADGFEDEEGEITLQEDEVLEYELQPQSFSAELHIENLDQKEHAEKLQVQVEDIEEEILDKDDYTDDDVEDDADEDYTILEEIEGITAEAAVSVEMDNAAIYDGDYIDQYRHRDETYTFQEVEDEDGEIRIDLRYTEEETTVDSEENLRKAVAEADNVAAINMAGDIHLSADEDLKIERELDFYLREYELGDGSGSEIKLFSDELEDKPAGFHDGYIDAGNNNLSTPFSSESSWHNIELMDGRLKLGGDDILGNFTWDAPGSSGPALHLGGDEEDHIEVEADEDGIVNPEDNKGLLAAAESRLVSNGNGLDDLFENELEMAGEEAGEDNTFYLELVNFSQEFIEKELKLPLEEDGSNEESASAQLELEMVEINEDEFVGGPELIVEFVEVTEEVSPDVNDEELIDVDKLGSEGKYELTVSENSPEDVLSDDAEEAELEFEIHNRIDKDRESDDLAVNVTVEIDDDGDVEITEIENNGFIF